MICSSEYLSQLACQLIPERLFGEFTFNAVNNLLLP